MKIVIVEDHQMFREVIRKVCTSELGHEIVAEADDGARGVELVGSLQPDLVLLDLQLPSLDGFGVAAELRKVSPRTKIVILSSHCDPYTVFRAEAAKVHGFVDKNTSSVAALKAALGAAEAGERWFSEAFLRVKATSKKNPASFDKRLTDQECSTLALLGVPLSDAEVGLELGVSPETVSRYRFNIMRKLDLQSPVGLVRYAQTNGFTLAARPPPGGSLLP